MALSDWIDRRDSIFSLFVIGPVASGRGLCDIDSVIFRVTKSRVRKLGSPSTTKIYRFLNKIERPSYRYIFVMQGLPNFLTRDLETLYHTLSISQSSCPLVVGPLRNAEDMEHPSYSVTCIFENSD